MKYSDIKEAHFIGIGGIGVSAIARMMLDDGKKVSGSDTVDSKITIELGKLGATINIGHDVQNVPDGVDVVVYTLAIADTNPELSSPYVKTAELFSYPEMLGIIAQDKFTIAVTGTHGKTTTTAMISKILSEADLSPTVIVGSFLAEGKSNFIAGNSNILVIEACEYRRSFLNYTPDVLVITNIDEDHLDYYVDLKDIQNAFSECVGRVKGGGYVVANIHHPHVEPVVVGGSEGVHYTDYTEYTGPAIELPLPGEHNQENAKAALAVARIFDVPDEISLFALKDFKGTWRRFEYKGMTKTGADVYDDYAHHPTEIKATLKAAREFFGDREIIVLFQPHLYSRTQLLMDSFAQSFDDINEVVVSPIYAAREQPIEGVTSETLCERIKEYNKNTVCLPDLDEVMVYAQMKAQKGDVIITMGAGDISIIADELLK